MAGMSSEATMASATSAFTGLRRATADDDLFHLAVAMISIRSVSDRSGEYSRIGAATIDSASRASVRTMYFGMQSSDLMLSASTARTRGNWSRARRSIVSIVSACRFLGFFPPQIGHEPRDLARQFEANVVVDIVGEMPVGVRCRARIGRHRAPRRDRPVLGEVMQDVSARVGLAGQLVLRHLRALLQQGENFLARHVALIRGQRGILRVALAWLSLELARVWTRAL